MIRCLHMIRCLRLVYVLSMSCLCLVYVLSMSCLCLVYVLSMSCLCLVYALSMSCLCLVYVYALSMSFCICTMLLSKSIQPKEIVDKEDVGDEYVPSTLFPRLFPRFLGATVSCLWEKTQQQQQQQTTTKCVYSRQSTNKRVKGLYYWQGIRFRRRVRVRCVL